MMGSQSDMDDSDEKHADESTVMDLHQDTSMDWDTDAVSELSSSCSCPVIPSRPPTSKRQRMDCILITARRKY